MQVTVANVTTDVLTYKGQKVCTTKQLAEFYGCSEKNIKDNYQNNIDRFIDGVHCIKVEGDDLRRFKSSLTDNIGQPLKFASVLMLWTEKGAARHAKMLSTDRAWDVFEQLEDTYFAAANMAKAIGYEGSVPSLVEDISAAAMTRVGGMVKGIVHKEIIAAICETLPSMIHGELAKQQTMVRKGETCGQVWKRYGLLTKGMSGYPTWFGNRLSARGCCIDDGGRAEVGGIASRLFNPDKCDAAMKAGLLAECNQYIQQRLGQSVLQFGKRAA